MNLRFTAGPIFPAAVRQMIGQGEVDFLRFDVKRAAFAEKVNGNRSRGSHVYSTAQRSRAARHISARAAEPLSTAAAWSLRRIAFTMDFTCGIARAARS